MTKHLEAKQALIDGMGTDAAWAIAQQDEGLNPDTTKQEWVRFMSKIIDREANTDALGYCYVGSPAHY